MNIPNVASKPQINAHFVATAGLPRTVIDSSQHHDTHHKHVVVIFLQNRLRAERQYLAAERRHLAETTGCLHDLTLVHIALLESDIISTERLLKNVH